MPHERPRYLHPLLELSLKASPIVGVLGQRQTGKTTLISGLSKEYSTLDLSADLSRATLEPEAFLTQRQYPFVIDECQLAPPLFPALKEYVRQHPKHGQFLLSGSVRFTSRKAIQESLTGRILTLELLPFTLSEMHSLPLRDPTQAHRLSEKSKLTQLDFQKFIHTGGMPGISFKRNDKMTGTLWENHVNTLIQRDLNLLIQTTLRFSSIRNLIDLLAQQVGQPLDLSDLSRKTRISRPTLRKLIAAFESMFLIRLIPSEGGIQTPRIFFEDTGMATYLTAGNIHSSYSFVQAFYQCVRAFFFYSTERRFEFFQFNTRGGAYIPLAVRSLGTVTGWILLEEPEINQNVLASAQAFCKSYGKNSKVFILGPSLAYQKLSPQIFAGEMVRLL